ADGKPLERVNVTYAGPNNSGRQTMPNYQGIGAYQEQGNTTQTDALGHYRLESLPNNPAKQLSAFSDTFKPEVKADVAVDQENVDFILKKKQSGTFTGIVLESNTEKPVTDFTVQGAEYDVPA